MTVCAPRTNNYMQFSIGISSTFRTSYPNVRVNCVSAAQCYLFASRNETDDASTNTNMSTNIHIHTHSRIGSGVRESCGKSKSAIVVVVVVYAPRIPYKCFAQKTVIQVEVIFCKTNAPLLLLLLLPLLIVLHINIRNVQAKRNNNKKKLEKIKL